MSQGHGTKEEEINMLGSKELFEKAVAYEAKGNSASAEKALNLALRAEDRERGEA